MAESKNRLWCPVCDGVQLEKLRPAEELELTLDHCDECGGMWFDSGEVRQLRFCPPEILSGLITVKKQLHTVECPECGRSMTRNAGECPACRHANTIDCPSCSSELERVQSDRFTVDVCRDCRGVWFDNIDLSQVWNLQFDSSAKAGEGEPGKSTEVSDSLDTVVAILRHSKDAGFEGGSEDEGQSAGVAATADGADGVFGRIADIIGGIFSPSD